MNAWLPGAWATGAWSPGTWQGLGTVRRPSRVRFVPADGRGAAVQIATRQRPQEADRKPVETGDRPETQTAQRPAVEAATRQEQAHPARPDAVQKGKREWATD